MAEEREKKIELILIKLGLLSEQGLMQAVEEKKKHPEKSIETILQEQEIISQFDYIRALGIKHDLPLVNLAAQKISVKVLSYVSEEMAKKHGIIPVHETEYGLYIATSNPTNYMIHAQIGQVSGKQVSLLLATKRDIIAAIDQNYIQRSVNDVMKQIEEQFGEEEASAEETKVHDFDTDGKSESVIKAASLIFEQAYQKKASDIHIEPLEDLVLVRMRIDGELVETMSFAKTAFSHLLSRLKVLGGLDIAEKRIPQDGRMSILLLGETVNMRISTLPTLYGEKVVIRLLGTSNSEDIMDIEDLQIEQDSYAKLVRAMEAPNGILLVTGPTGSGKSTTVYSVLKRLAKPTINVITVEDPVEKMIPRINQVQVNQKAGLTFAAGLRSILRQDPDIVMIGEIRDNETAKIGAKAAVTGHLVIATMHTNNAASTFMRMMDMDVEPYIVASAIVGVIAQRLVKKICTYCKEEYTPEKEELFDWVGEVPEKFYRGRGCPMCNNSGYRGRQGVYEVINMDVELKKMIVRQADDSEISAYLKQIGFKTLGDNVQMLVRDGITTLQEMKKISKSGE